MRELLYQTISTLWAYRLKSVLAIVAIAWGVTAVVVLVALGEGFYNKQSSGFIAVINETQMAMSGKASKAWQGLPPRRDVTLTEDNIEPLASSPLIGAISLAYVKDSILVASDKGNIVASSAAGIDTNYLSFSSLKLMPGSRNISPLDLKNRSRVAILGWQLAKSSQIKIGQQIFIRQIPFTVIGIIDGDNVVFSHGDGSRVDIPSTTFKDIWDQPPSLTLVKPTQGVTISEIRQRLIGYFSQVLHFDPTDRNAIRLPDFSGSAEMFKAILRGIQLFLGASGAMTLAVGALGVANIMFLSVTERTREIGVRLAIGATKFSILRQFLTEGFILVLLGALVGISMAWLIVAILQSVALPQWLGKPTITLDSLFVSLTITFVLAILASWFPAKRAASLQPITALSARV